MGNSAVREIKCQLCSENFKGGSGQCKICGKIICKDKRCSTYSKYPLPNEDGLELKCERICQSQCTKTAVAYWMVKHQEEVDGQFGYNVENYLLNNNRVEINIPAAIPDSMERKALRAGDSLIFVAKVAGYGKYADVLKTIMAGKIAFDFLKSCGIDFELFRPLLQILRHETGPTAGLDLYYLCRSHELAWKVNTAAERTGYDTGNPGVVHSLCPSELLDLGGRFVKMCTLKSIPQQKLCCWWS